MTGRSDSAKLKQYLLLARRPKRWHPDSEEWQISSESFWKSENLIWWGGEGLFFFLPSLIAPSSSPSTSSPTSFSLFCSPLPTTLCVCQLFCLSLSLNPTMPGTANVMTLDFRDFSYLELCPRNLETFLSVLTTLTCIYAKYNPAQNSCTKPETA